MPIRWSRAVWRPLGKQTQPAMRAHDIVCLHTMVGFLGSTDSMFAKDGYVGTESHFGVGGAWGRDVARGLDGACYQWQDLARSADANLEGWHRVISIETADNAPAKVEQIARWSPAQVATLVGLLAWLCSKEAHAGCPDTWACHHKGIPAELVPDSKPGRRGIAYHRQGCEHSDGPGSHPGWLVKGGERWSVALGKGCPGPARIEQLAQDVLPAVARALTPKPSTVKPATATPAPTAQESDMRLVQAYTYDSKGQKVLQNTVWLLGVGVRTRVNDQPMLAAYKAMGVPGPFEVGLPLLNRAVDADADALADAKVAAALATITARLADLQAEVKDDATAGDVADLRQLVADLHPAATPA